MTERLHFHFSLFTFMHWKPTPVFLPGESQGRWSHWGVRLWRRTECDHRRCASLGSHRVGHDWSDLAAAAAAWVYNHKLLFLKWINFYINYVMYVEKICHIEMITMYRHIASGFSNFLIFRFLNIIFLQVVFNYKVRTPQKMEEKQMNKT